MSMQVTINPKLDFAIERVIDAPIRLVWEALTTPEHLKEWYMPRQWAGLPGRNRFATGRHYPNRHRRWRRLGSSQYRLHPGSCSYGTADLDLHAVPRLSPSGL